MTATEINIAFIADGKNCHPINVINRILDQLQIDFQRGNLVEYYVSLGTFKPIDEDVHILICRQQDPTPIEERKEDQHG